MTRMEGRNRERRSRMDGGRTADVLSIKVEVCLYVFVCILSCTTTRIIWTLRPLMLKLEASLSPSSRAVS